MIWFYLFACRFNSSPWKQEIKFNPKSTFLFFWLPMKRNTRYGSEFEMGRISSSNNTIALFKILFSLWTSVANSLAIKPPTIRPAVIFVVVIFCPALSLFVVNFLLGIICVCYLWLVLFFLSFSLVLSLPGDIFVWCYLFAFFFFFYYPRLCLLIFWPDIISCSPPNVISHYVTFTYCYFCRNISMYPPPPNPCHAS